MQRSKYSWRKIFEDFRRRYPEIRKQVYYWEPCNFATIRLWFKDGRLATYNDYDKEVKMQEGSWITPCEVITQRERRRKEHEQHTKVFSQMLQYWLQEKELSQQDLADALGVSKQSISAYANGKRYPNEIMRKRISFVLGVQPEDLIMKGDEK